LSKKHLFADFWLVNQKQTVMKNQFTLIIFLLLFSVSSAQQTITGTVTDNSNKPISGANVYLEGTYDGSSTDEH
jgi:protocatechuate 3,4-dioxygenase beta subunit